MTLDFGFKKNDTETTNTTTIQPILNWTFET